MALHGSGGVLHSGRLLDEQVTDVVSADIEDGHGDEEIEGF
jgi:hypothetical protein